MPGSVSIKGKTVVMTGSGDLTVEGDVVKHTGTGTVTINGVTMTGSKTTSSASFKRETD